MTPKISSVSDNLGCYVVLASSISTLLQPARAACTRSAVTLSCLSSARSLRSCSWPAIVVQAAPGPSVQRAGSLLSPSEVAAGTAARASHARTTAPAPNHRPIFLSPRSRRAAAGRSRVGSKLKSVASRSSSSRRRLCGGVRLAIGLCSDCARLTVPCRRQCTTRRRSLTEARRARSGKGYLAQRRLSCREATARARRP
jgi:hypothetical protein